MRNRDIPHATQPSPATAKHSGSQRWRRFHLQVLTAVALILFGLGGGSGTKKQRFTRIAIGVVILAALVTIGFAWEWIVRGVAFLFMLAIWCAITFGALYLAGIRTRKRSSRTSKPIAFSDAPGPVFERWVAGEMRAAGWRNVVVSGGSGDRGVDIRGVAPSGRRFIVQCKRYSKPVGARDVQSFIGIRHTEHRDAPAIFVTSSSYTAQAASHLRNAGVVALDVRDVRRGLAGRLRGM